MDAMTGQPPRAILVLGMHRSGTSSTTRVLNLLGAELGSRLLPPVARDNEKGFWESQDAFEIDELLLAGLGRTWHDVRTMPEGWLESAAACDARAAITRFIQKEFATSPLWAVKDPRLCRLAPVWLRALAECGVAPGLLFVVRHPLEVAASLQARNGWSRSHSLLLWTQHLLEAERATRVCPRVMVTYDQILEDWPGSMARVSRTLGVAWPRSFDEARAEIDAFLDAGERHHRALVAPAAGPAHSGMLPTLVAELFERCIRLSAGDDAWADLHRSAEDFPRVSALWGAYVEDSAGVHAAHTVFAAELHSLRSGLAADSQAVKAELETLRSGLGADSRAARSELETLRSDLEKLRSGLAADSQAVRSELETLARLLAEHADAVAVLERELTKWRRDQLVPTLRRWLGRS